MGVSDTCFPTPLTGCHLLRTLEGLQEVLPVLGKITPSEQHPITYQIQNEKNKQVLVTPH